MERSSSLLADIEHLCSAESNELRLYEKAVDRIFDSSDRYDWVGIYKVEGDELVLSAWRGPRPTEHTRIPLDKGICGFVATEGDTVVVGDVNADPRYLGCFVSTKSEIVVPIKVNGDVIAEIDIDSDSPSAFEEDDRKTLEVVASRLAGRLEEITT
jgi:putative methionine-R-sulfoxide reductase with GAF domain